MAQDAEPDQGDAESEAGDHPNPDDEEQSDAGSEERGDVPYERFAQQTARLNETITTLTSQLQNQQDQAAREKTEEKTYTAAELSSLVEAGKLSQDDADEIREVQLAKRVTKEVVGAVAQNSQQDQLETDLRQYAEAIPALDDPTSDEVLRVKDELRYLYSVGQPEGVGTMLAATRAVFGPLSAIKAPAGTKKKTEAHQEGSSGGGDEPGDGGKGDKLPTMTSKQKAHYRSAIDKGIYADWAAVAEELNYTPGG